MTEEKKRELGVTFDLTEEDMECINIHLDTSKYTITDVDIDEFCKEYGMQQEAVTHYLYAVTHPNLVCAWCSNNNFDGDSYPCNKCIRNPEHMDYFDGSRKLTLRR